MRQHSIQWLNQKIEEIIQSDKGLVDFYKEGKWHKAYDLKEAVDEDTYGEMICTYNNCATRTTHFVNLPIVTVNRNADYRYILLTNIKVSNNELSIMLQNDAYVKLSNDEVNRSGRCFYQLPIYNIVKVDTNKYIATKVYISKYTSPKHINGDELVDGLHHDFVTLDFKRSYSLPDVKILLGTEYNEEVSMFKSSDCKSISLKDLGEIYRPSKPSPYVFSL